jgi:cysteine desulfurase/selenocysteine lyase
MMKVFTYLTQGAVQTMPAPIDFAAIRAREFPIGERIAYLDHATVSPMPTRTAAVLAERIATMQDPSREHGLREAYAVEARERMGRLMNVPPQQIALLSNLAEAVATVANGLDLQPGDEVIIPEQEFSSLVYPWLNLEARGVQTVFVPKTGPATDFERIVAAISPRTKVLALSHVEFQNGFRHDMVELGELCRRHGILFVVDVTQSLAILPVYAAAWQADVIAVHGYKWMMAMHGIAALFVSEAAMARIRPTAPGRSSVKGGFELLDYALDWHSDARRYMGGGPNWLGAAAVAASLSLVEEIGVASVAKRAKAVSDRILKGLADLPVEIMTDVRPDHRSSILTFTTGSVDADKALVAAAKEHGVYVGRRGMGVRTAASFWNNGVDADRLLEVVRDQTRR